MRHNLLLVSFLMPTLFVAQLTLISWRRKEISQTQCWAYIIQEIAIQLLIRLAYQVTKENLSVSQVGSPISSQLEAYPTQFKNTLAWEILIRKDIGLVLR